ncbi:MAG: hypothetical protein LKG19_01890 [Saprospiraceae bacterium]|jgi:hypothetical protein|nr:hypothetical protein [Saprospiraceae bacterium]
MEQIPNYLNIFFGLTTLFTIGIFYWAANQSKFTLIILLSWMILQFIIGTTGFYTITEGIPPRFLLLVLPPFIFIGVLFSTTNGRLFIDGLNLRILTMLHIVRIPVELVLYGLYVYKAVPELMTFEGRNYDIVSGLTVPIIYYLGFVKKQFNTRLLLIWNFICLGLLFNIVVHAVLSAPFPFQQLAFDQPNIAVLHAPFNGLPSCVVPLVLLSHLAAIRQLLRSKAT